MLPPWYNDSLGIAYGCLGAFLVLISFIVFVFCLLTKRMDILDERINHGERSAAANVLRQDLVNTIVESRIKFLRQNEEPTAVPVEIEKEEKEEDPLREHCDLLRRRRPVPQRLPALATNNIPRALFDFDPKEPGRDADEE